MAVSKPADAGGAIDPKPLCYVTVDGTVLVTDGDNRLKSLIGGLKPLKVDAGQLAGALPLYGPDTLQTLTAENARLRERVEAAEKERKEAAVFGADVLHEALIATEALLAARQTIERLTEALRPFSAVADEYDDREDDAFEVWRDCHEPVTRAMTALRNFRRARAVLSDEETKG